MYFSLPAGLTLTWGLLDLFHTPLGLWEGGWLRGRRFTASPLPSEDLMCLSKPFGTRVWLEMRCEEASPVHTYTNAHTHADKIRVKLFHLSCWIPPCLSVEACDPLMMIKAEAKCAPIPLLWPISFCLYSLSHFLFPSSLLHPFTFSAFFFFLYSLFICFC